MAAKPTYTDLEKTVGELKKELAGHKSIEKLLWQKQDELFKVFDSLEAIVYVADMQTYEILFANRYTEKLFGRITGKTCWQVLQADMSGPCPFCPNNRLLTPDGKAEEVIVSEMQNTINGRWYSVRDRAIDWFDGRVVHLQIGVDISDSKNAEAALQASEEKFRTVADFTYDWEYWINEKGGFNYISPSFTRLTGYSVAELEKDPSLLIELIHPDNKQCFAEHLHEELDSEKVCHLEFCIINRAGDERWISHYCQPVYNDAGKFKGRRASNRDITERIMAQKDIKLNELRQATLLNLYEMQNLPVADVCKFVLEASLPLTASAIGFLGLISEDECRMTILSWSKSVMNQCKVHRKPITFDVQKAGIWGEAVRTRQPVIINDYEASPLKRGVPAGHVAIDRFMAIPLFDHEKIVAVAAVGNKRQEYDKKDIRQLQLLVEGMWQIIKRRQAEEELVTQADMIKKFTNSVSHDLKNPAMAIHGLAKILKRKYREMDSGKLEDFLDQIEKSAAQVVSLSEDINIYISTREAPLRLQDLAIKEHIWKTIRDEFAPRLREKNITWVETDVDIPIIRADQNSLLRVFRNLVDNALKYGGSGLSEISLGYEASETHHILSVKNDGAPIPPDETKSIFEIFKRRGGEGTQPGTGLGLATVKEIAKNHKGDSWVISNAEDKTTFYISIAQNI